MFGIGMPELIIILVIALIVIGPGKLPDLAKALGKGMAEFRKATEEIKENLDMESVEDDFKGLQDDLIDSVSGVESPTEPESPESDLETPPEAKDWEKLEKDWEDRKAETEEKKEDAPKTASARENSENGQ